MRLRGLVVVRRFGQPVLGLAQVCVVVDRQLTCGRLMVMASLIEALRVKRLMRLVAARWMVRLVLSMAAVNVFIEMLRAEMVANWGTARLRRSGAVGSAKKFAAISGGGIDARSSLSAARFIRCQRHIELASRDIFDNVFK
jgi:hypothetical protein